ncbi:MAG: UvrD-helicase domain-containing protein [Spirochaetales bacterium]|nr:UvrD-helicase domain-containing protein [Spirochaetales bacterium]
MEIKTARKDTDQEKAITVEQNAVISASAGSGKTTVLAERFVHLLETKNVSIDQVLALTFTRKAAAEMYDRIRKRLEAMNTPNAVKALGDFDKACIFTIDSFCSQIARSWSEYFGVPSDYAYDDDEKTAVNAALDFMLKNEDNKALAEFVRVNGFERVWKDFFAHMAFHHFQITGTQSFAELFKQQIVKLREAWKIHSAEFRDLSASIAAMENDSKTALENRSRLKPMKELDWSPDDGESQGRLADFLDSLKISKLRGKGDTVEPANAMIEDWRTKLELLKQVLASLANADTGKSVSLLLDNFRQEFFNLKRAKKILNHQDVAGMAVQTLLLNKQLRLYYKTQFRYILIDEFQDNNKLQKDLLYLLAEKPENLSANIPEGKDLVPDKLFFVGDDKQSIYGFRGADVSVFKSLHTDLAGDAGKPLVLRTNYRSTPGLVSFFNDLFPGVFGNASEPYEAVYNKAESTGVRNAAKPVINILYKPFNDNNGEKADYGSTESEAFYTIRFLRDAITSGVWQVKEGNTFRKAGYDDVALLMRSTGNQIVYERMLRIFDIPYSTQGLRSLFMESPVNDIYNLLQFALFSADRAAYAGLLRSPIVNVSDMAFVQLMLHDGKPFECEADLDETDRNKLLLAKKLYSFVKASMDIKPITRLLSDIIHKSGYRYHILKNKSFHNYLEFFDYLLVLARQSEEKGEILSRFLDRIRENLGKYEKQDDLEILKWKESGVKIMSIHKSKGLEFPVVILTNTGNTGMREGLGSRPYYYSEELGVSFNTDKSNYFYTQNKADSEARDLAELKRLLYVALTRAESRLIITGAHNSRNRQTTGTHLNMILSSLNLDRDSLPSKIEKENYEIQIQTIEDLTEETYMTSARPRAGKKPLSFSGSYAPERLDVPEFPVRQYSVSRLNEQYASLRDHAESIRMPVLPIDDFLTEGKLHEHFGTLTHYIIHKKICGTFSKEMLPESLLVEFGLHRVEELVQAAINLADTFLVSKTGEQVSESASVMTEIPFVRKVVAPNGPVWIQGIVDLVFEHEESCHLIDFKTDAVVVPSRYNFQLAFYAQAMKELFSKPVKSSLCCLRDNRLIDMPDRIDENEVIQLVSSLSGEA